ncbi:PP2C family protein-serine/threonine phosphatase [Streptomyces sp. NPDC002454]|uniref:PP2C family protein-serine/threonine phosphatase n=1 Tax=Streptomyces sp. NPDC002490 TaxID=3154416 RepID=UPI00331EFF51
MIRTSAGDLPRARSALRAFGPPALWGALAATYELVCPLARAEDLAARFLTGAVFCAAGAGYALHARTAVRRETRHLRQLARAVQNALLHPLPDRLDGLALAGGRRTAAHGAGVGGDLYEVLATEHGVRVVMGDVRGHGPAALAAVAAVLGSFREAGHEEPRLAAVLHRLDRAFARHLAERATRPGAAVSAAGEDFVTLLLLEIARDGRVLALNCGHPWPYRLRALAGPCGTRGRAFPVTDADPLPPLGPFPLPELLPPVNCGRLLPGEALFLHTDGAVDARDRHGRFFPLDVVLMDAIRSVPLCPEGVVRTVFHQLLRHTGGPPTDDVTLLVLRNDRPRTGPGPAGPVPRPAHRVI